MFFWTCLTQKLRQVYNLGHLDTANRLCCELCFIVVTKLFLFFLVSIPVAQEFRMHECQIKEISVYSYLESKS